MPFQRLQQAARGRRVVLRLDAGQFHLRLPGGRGVQVEGAVGPCELRRELKDAEARKRGVAASRPAKVRLSIVTPLL